MFSKLNSEKRKAAAGQGGAVMVLLSALIGLLLVYPMFAWGGGLYPPYIIFPVFMVVGAFLAWRYRAAAFSQAGRSSFPKPQKSQIILGCVVIFGAVIITGIINLFEEGSLSDTLAALPAIGAILIIIFMPLVLSYLFYR